MKMKAYIYLFVLFMCGSFFLTEILIEEVMHARAKSANLLFDILDEDKDSEDKSVKRIVIFAHGTVKFSFINQLGDEFKNFEESRKLFYDIEKNNMVDCGRAEKYNRIELNKKEAGFRGLIPGLVEIEENNIKKEMNSETLRTIFYPIAKKNGSTKFFIFNWTGGLTHKARTASAIELVMVINKLRTKYPCAEITYFGHSHGGTVACEAIAICQEYIKNGDNFFKFFTDLKSLIYKNKFDFFTKFEFPEVQRIYFPSVEKIISLLPYFKDNYEKYSKDLLQKIDDVLFYRDKMEYHHYKFLDKLVCIGSPMPKRSHRFIAAKNKDGEYLVDIVIALSCPNDAVLDPYVSFPLYTSNKFYKKYRNKGVYNFILTIEKDKIIYGGLRHHDCWYNDLLGNNLKDIIEKYINEIILFDQGKLIELSERVGMNLEMRYSIEDKKFHYFSLQNDNKLFTYNENIFFSKETIFLYVTGFFRLLKTLIWDMKIRKSIESMDIKEYYKGE